VRYHAVPQRVCAINARRRCAVSGRAWRTRKNDGAPNPLCRKASSPSCAIPFYLASLVKKRSSATKQDKRVGSCRRANPYAMRRSVLHVRRRCYNPVRKTASLCGGRRYTRTPAASGGSWLPPALPAQCAEPQLKRGAQRAPLAAIARCVGCAIPADTRTLRRRQLFADCSCVLPNAIDLRWRLIPEVRVGRFDRLEDRV
jgi:hypothetical protein